MTHTIGTKASDMLVDGNIDIYFNDPDVSVGFRMAGASCVQFEDCYDKIYQTYSKILPLLQDTDNCQPDSFSSGIHMRNRTMINLPLSPLVTDQDVLCAPRAENLQTFWETPKSKKNDEEPSHGLQPRWDDMEMYQNLYESMKVADLLKQSSFRRVRLTKKLLIAHVLENTRSGWAVKYLSTLPDVVLRKGCITLHISRYGRKSEVVQRIATELRKTDEAKEVRPKKALRTTMQSGIMRLVCIVRNRRVINSPRIPIETEYPRADLC